MPSEQCRPLLEELRAQRGLLGLTLQPGASLQPPGDVIGLVVLSRTYSAFTRVLDRHGVGRVPGTSYRSSEPVSVVSTSAPQIATDTSASSWEEMELTLAKESQFTVDVALLMFVAGFIAAVGIASGAVHAIAGAMVIAPGFEPCVRVVLGGMTRSVSWRRGAYSLVAGYALLVLGAATAAVIMRASGTPLLTGSGSYHRTDVLVTYWTTLSVGAVGVSAAAALAGATLIASHRSVLTAGVMLALALVPAAALVPVALVAGDAAVALKAFIRWSVELLLVFAGSAMIIGLKRRADRRSDLRL